MTKKRKKKEKREGGEERGEGRREGGGEKVEPSEDYEGRDNGREEATAAGKLF